MWGGGRQGAFRAIAGKNRPIWPLKSTPFLQFSRRTRCLTILDTEAGNFEKAVEAHCLITEDTVANGKNHEPIHLRRIPQKNALPLPALHRQGSQEQPPRRVLHGCGIRAQACHQAALRTARTHARRESRPVAWRETPDLRPRNRARHFRDLEALRAALRQAPQTDARSMAALLRNAPRNTPRERPRGRAGHQRRSNRPHPRATEDRLRDRQPADPESQRGGQGFGADPGGVLGREGTRLDRGRHRRPLRRGHGRELPLEPDGHRHLQRMDGGARFLEPRPAQRLRRFHRDRGGAALRAARSRYRQRGASSSTIICTATSPGGRSPW